MPRDLATGRATDALPAGDDGRRVALLLGYTHRPEAELRDDYRRLTRRARRVVEPRLLRHRALVRGLNTRSKTGPLRSRRAHVPLATSATPPADSHR